MSVIKPNLTHRRIAIFLLAIFLPSLLPINMLYAANNGPNAPEAASFEPVDATDMVSLATGDMAYALPIMNVPSPEGGYPLVLAYHGGIGYDQEASMVGLGWNLNPGAVNRSVNGAPDDWKSANIEDSEFVEHWSKDVNLSVGVYNYLEASLGYSWDSNGTRKGSVGVGVKLSDSGWGVGVGVGLSNKGGLSGNARVGYKKNGFGVGVYADTEGLVAVSATASPNTGSYTNGMAIPSIGISLYSDQGQVGASLIGSGSASLTNASGTTNQRSHFGAAAAFYLYCFSFEIGYHKTNVSRLKLDYNHVYGPLYFSEISSGQSEPVGAGITYNDIFTNTHNREIYMDTYNQLVPEYISSAVGVNSAFDNLKPAYNAPAYDNYEVNAQGISGMMSPRILENGMLINAGIDSLYDESYFEACDGDAERGTQCYPATSYPTSNCSFGPPGSNPHIGQAVTEARLYVNSHYSNDSNQQFHNTFGGNSGNSIHFYFDYQFPASLEVNPSSPIANTSVNPDDAFSMTGSNPITSRRHNANYVEAFTNGQILTNHVEGIFLEAKDYDRAQDAGYVADGIGGYRITTSDGKTYHYSRPVYQFEQIYRRLIPNMTDGGSYSEHGLLNGTIHHDLAAYKEKRRVRPYATHWLLTAITGPDYVKLDDAAYPTEKDFGYWVRFDYGNWTDGYVWRTPFEDYRNMSSNLMTGAAEEYSWGRKQLVYLDKVVTRTHTALFVKSLRRDDYGKGIGHFEQDNGYPTNDHQNDVNVRYRKQPGLKLDQVILVKNEDFRDVVEPSSQITDLNPPGTHTENTAIWHSLDVNDDGLGDDQITYAMNQQLNVIDAGDFSVNPGTGNFDIYDIATKIIRFDQGYSLANGSPNSTAGGRLTLNNVEVLGRSGEKVMPPYTFNYIGEETNYCANQYTCLRDEWGYLKNNPSLWSLNKITMPTGAAIEFEYEEDDYYTEAFSRALFDENMLGFSLINLDQDIGGWRPALLLLRNTNYWGEAFDFTDYFDPNEHAFGQFFCCSAPPDDVAQGNSDYCYWTGDQGELTIIAVTPTAILFKVPEYIGQIADFPHVTNNDDNPINIIQAGDPRCYVDNNCPSNDSHSSYHFTFKFVANKVPDGKGGGIRVKKISTVNETGQKFATEYSYGHPKKERTSGITSYAPKMGSQYIAYQTEIPGPRVMYEYVTLTEKGINNERLGKTQYQFNVLKPVLNVFDPNLRSGDHFKSNVNIQPLNALTWGVSVDLKDNFSTLGSVVKVTQFNREDQIMSQLKNEFLNLEELADDEIEKPGAVRESFHSFKSVYNYVNRYMSGDANIGIFQWSQMCPIGTTFAPLPPASHYAVSASKTIYPNVQKKKTEIVGTQKKVTEFKKIDPKSGLFLETHTKLADGTEIKTELVPAYTKYGGMGSKVISSANKHMLTQEAMNITSINKGNGWKTIDANITTWYNGWSYRDYTGREFQDSQKYWVWRKHKNFVWKDNVDSDGTYSTFLDGSTSYFDWVNEQPQSPKWQKISEVTKYSRFSSPLETKDINHNLASSKMASKESKVIVSGNSRFTEMYYSGAEYVAGGNYFAGEVQGADFRSDNIAHTGNYSVKAETLQDKVFLVTGSSGTHDYYERSNQNVDYPHTFRPGKYKVSVWAYRHNSSTDRPGDPGPGPIDGGVTSNLIVNGNPIKVAETVNAGCWQQLNYYFTLPENRADNSIYIKAMAITGDNYYDDFRMHPISSTINSYVYNNHTDDLVSILNSNNMGTTYLYDTAGRLMATYMEDVDNPGADGGFKLISQNKQNYKDIITVAPDLQPILGNCRINAGKLKAQVTNQDVKSYNNKFVTEVSGGSGNYEYQYKWLTDYTSKTYTNYVLGNKNFDVPYVPHYCVQDNNGNGTYAKAWDFKVKIKDLVNNMETEQSYQYEGQCVNKKSYSIEPDLQITSKDGQCPEKFSFKVHLKDNSANGNFKYEYAYYNPNIPFTAQTLQWTDVTNAKGAFCPTYTKVADASCETGYRKAIYYTYRITDLNTQEVSAFVPNVFFGECVNANETIPLVSGVSGDQNYQKTGTVVVKSKDGKVVTFYTVQ